jgi:hypothetical protein
VGVDVDCPVEDKCVLRAAEKSEAVPSDAEAKTSRLHLGDENVTSEDDRRLDF